MSSTGIANRNISIQAWMNGKEQEITIAIIFDLSPDEQARKALNSTMASIENAGNCGMLSGERFAPADSVMSLLSKVDGNDCEVVYTYKVRSIDPGMIRVLWGMLNHYSHYICNIASLKIFSGIQESGILVTLDAVEKGVVPYPKAYSQLPFRAVRVDPVRVDKHRRVMFEFVTPASDAVDEKLASAFQGFEALCFGGFPKIGHQPWETGLSYGDRFWVDECTNEQVIDYFEASEVAFNSIFNFAAHLHATLAAVREVRIY